MNVTATIMSAINISFHKKTPKHKQLMEQLENYKINNGAI